MFCVAIASSAAHAQYPDHPITMIVPFPPGGVADTVARPVAEAMSRELKQPVVIENKPGAGGGIGMAQVAKAKPDGYTILMSLASLTVLPEADKILGRDADVPDRPAGTDRALHGRPDGLRGARRRAVEDARRSSSTTRRSNPGKFTYGSSGNYGTMHVPMEMFAGAAGVKMVHVPYTGAGPAIVGLLGGRSMPSRPALRRSCSTSRAGKVRVLAHWGDVRLVALPDVPSLKELGTNVEYAQWSGCSCPRDTRRARSRRLREAARAAANDPKVKEVLLTAGSPVQYLDMPEFQKYVDTDATKMSDVVKRIGKIE